MKAAVFLAKLGDRIISAMVGILILVMLLYGGYSLWDTAMLYRGAFTSNELMKYKPSDDGSGGPTLEELRKINPDVRGWLTVDDTHIDYPVVQGKTDMEYVNKDVYGEFSLSGAIFMDSQNAADFSDSYNLLYGHHMANGAMFGDIVSFVEQKYFDARKTARLYHLDGSVSEITLFACVETDAYDDKIYQTQSWTPDNMANLLNYIQQKAVQYRDIGITGNDQVIALSTCAEAETNGRVIVFGRLEQKTQVQEGGA